MGKKATFTFTLTGTSLNKLTEQDFVKALSSGGTAFFAAQFSGITGSGITGSKSDNEPGTLQKPADPPPPAPVPEPATVLLLGSGLVGLGIRRKRKFKAKG